MKFPSKAFSLIELLVALSVMAIIAALVFPRFLTLQTQAQDTVAKSIESELNNTFSQWQSAGGIISQNNKLGTSF